MRYLLTLFVLLSLNFTTQASGQSDGHRYKILRISDSGATIVDTRSMSKSFAGKYVTVWMFLMSDDLADTGIDYFQSLVRMDCGARTARREKLLRVGGGESTEVGRPELTDSPISPESSSELAFEFACKQIVPSDVETLSLLSMPEVLELNQIILANAAR